LLTEGKRIGNAYFLIEMSTDGKTLSVSAYEGESKTSLELVVNEKRHRSYIGSSMVTTLPSRPVSVWIRIGSSSTQVAPMVDRNQARSQHCMLCR